MSVLPLGDHPHEPSLPPSRLNLSLPRSPHAAAMADISRQFAALRPFGGARLIVADPPWSFVNWSEKGAGRGPEQHYSTRSLEWICDLPVGDLANRRGCLLMLWATNPHLRQAFEVMDAWGFRFSTGGTWVKRTTTGLLAFGGGHVFRSSNEPILIGVRGRVTIPVRNQRSVILTDDDDDSATPDSLGVTIEAIRREHSRKPDLFYQAARTLVPDGPAIELFSRESRDGFICWGDEVGKFDKENTDG